MKIEKLLAPIDFSPLSRHALIEADRRACASNARLHLLHVHQIVEVALLDFTYVEPAEKISEICDALENQLREWATELKTPQEHISIAVHTGVPAHEIIQASHQFDLIVMGTHGRTGISHFLMGSVTERVVQGAHCSVLIYKHQDDR